MHLLRSGTVCKQELQRKNPITVDVNEGGGKKQLFFIGSVGDETETAPTPVGAGARTDSGSEN